MPQYFSFNPTQPMDGPNQCPSLLATADTRLFIIIYYEIRTTRYTNKNRM